MWSNRWVRWGTLVAVAVVALWLSGGLGAGRRWSGDRLHELGVVPETGPEPQEIPSEDGQPVSEPGPGMAVITSSTTLVFRTIYVPCELEAREEYPVDTSQVGQSREQFIMNHPGWQLVEFTPDLVVVEREVEGQCEELLAARTIRLRDDTVVVFFGMGGDQAPVMMVTDIEADDLLAGDRERLEQGVTVADEAEVWLILEGLTR